VNLSIKTIIKIVQYLLLYTMSHQLTSNLWHDWRKEDQEEGKKHEMKYTNKESFKFIFVLMVLQ